VGTPLEHDFTYHRLYTGEAVYLHLAVRVATGPEPVGRGKSLPKTSLRTKRDRKISIKSGTSGTLEREIMPRCIRTRGLLPSVEFTSPPGPQVVQPQDCSPITAGLAMELLFHLSRRDRGLRQASATRIRSSPSRHDRGTPHILTGKQVTEAR
jgi:hypothetical protein